MVENEWRGSLKDRLGPKKFKLYHSGSDAEVLNEGCGDAHVLRDEISEAWEKILYGGKKQGW